MGFVGHAARWTMAGLGLAALGYAASVATAWCRYGHPAPPSGDELDPLLDRFMPKYEVAERHSVRIAAPPDIALSVATHTDLQQSPLVRAIIKTRERMLGAAPTPMRSPKGLLEELEGLGWRVLFEQPGREIVVGAVTQPWVAEVMFRGLAPDDFVAFDEPEHVRIAWTMRADPVSSGGSILRTETRVVATDSVARRTFRWYWARFSPGIVLIRRVLLQQIKRDAERLAALRSHRVAESPLAESAGALPG